MAIFLCRFYNDQFLGLLEKYSEAIFLYKIDTDEAKYGILTNKRI